MNKTFIAVAMLALLLALPVSAGDTKKAFYPRTTGMTSALTNCVQFPCIIGSENTNEKNDYDLLYRQYWLQKRLRNPSYRYFNNLG